jgi:hypothetical protein
METFDYNDSPRPIHRYTEMLFNILTVLLLLGALIIMGVFAVLFVNPYAAFNPFPPPTLPVALTYPTATATAGINLPPTWTPTATLIPTETSTPRPSATLPPTETVFSLVTPGPDTPTATSGGMPFVLQEGSPVSIANIAHPELGCNWMGVAGQVLDLTGAAVPGQQVQLGGVLGGQPVPGGEMLTLTGLAPEYGPGYYEFTLADKPVASRHALWVQLLDQAGLSMSDKIYFDTSGDCEKNLIILNFKQVR